MSDTQGGRANAHGWELRRAVAGVLLAHGFAEVQAPRGDPRKGLEAFLRNCDCDLRRPQRAFANEVPVCVGVHETPLNANFLLHVVGWPAPLALMTRSQEGSGSAMEKLEYLWANLAERFPCRSFVLLAGPAWTPAVRRRAFEHRDRSGGRLAGVFTTLDEVSRWLTDGAAYPAQPEPQLL